MGLHQQRVGDPAAEVLPKCPADSLPESTRTSARVSDPNQSGQDGGTGAEADRMQMAAPPPGSDADRAPSPSPGGGFSLLGQQLHYAPTLQQQQQQQQHQQPQSQPQPQAHAQQQHHEQNQPQAEPQQGRSGLSFSLGSNQQQQQSLHQLLPFQGQGRGHHGQHGYHQQGLPFGMGPGYGMQDLLEADPGAGFLGRGDMMNTLAIIHQGIGQVQALLPLMAPGGPPNSAVAHQQAATAQRLVAVISQLAMAATAMLPAAQQQAMQHPAPPSDHQLGNGFGGGSSYGVYQQQGGAMLGPMPGAMGGYGGSSQGMLGSGGMTGQQQQQQQQQPQQAQQQQHLGSQGGALVVNGPRNSIPCSSLNASVEVSPGPDIGADLLAGGSQGGPVVDHAAGGMNRPPVDDESGGGSRDDDDDVDGDNLPPGSYDLVEMEAVEILAEHTHFCEICGKGFKRDANLRMHMRGHGDEYKTPAALARPDRSGQEPAVSRPRRYSCPCVGCKRNKKHRKFQPLKTMLCVKNHYRRSHCPKSLICTKCKSKRFSVMADLKTHEKHCGRDKWQCSCGTTFSRKDKLFGHIGLFQGHTPAVPLHEMEESGLDGPGSGYSPGSAVNGALGAMGGAGYASGAGAASSTDAQAGRGLLQSPSMLHGLFASNFLQGSSSAN